MVDAMDFKAPQDRVAQNAGMRSEIGPAPTRRVIGRSLASVYGVASYLAFLAAFLYAIGFVGNLAVPKSIDSGPEGLLPVAILVDTLLLLLFAVPHSVMARPAFKKWWTRFIPPPVERSTYVLVRAIVGSSPASSWVRRSCSARTSSATGSADSNEPETMIGRESASTLARNVRCAGFSYRGDRRFLEGRPFTSSFFRIQPALSSDNCPVSVANHKHPGPKPQTSLFA